MELGEYLKHLGVLPCPYHNYYYATDDMLKSELEEFSKGETRAEVVKRTEAVHAFTINPLVPSGKIAKDVLDELLIAHKNYLPQFAEIISKLDK